MKTIDLMFIVDITGSMGSFIAEARKRMKEILSKLSEKHNMDLKVGLSLYRDHASQGDAFVTCVFDLKSIDEIHGIIDSITVGGGGDAPEAVIDGIINGMDIAWRKDSSRMAFLIGDAPAHGMLNDGCCECGRTWGDAVHAMEEQDVTLYGIALSDTPVENFKMLCNFTGGILITGEDAINAIYKTLDSEFELINVGSQVVELLAKNYSKDKICEMLNVSREKMDLAMSK